jgi:hypothetical protein
MTELTKIVPERETSTPMAEQPIEVTFLVEEYRNIAATHDRLRGLLATLFSNFLVISAFPFTVAGIIIHGGNFTLSEAPPSIYIFFLLVGAGDLFLALAMLDGRLSQYRYARTVNAIRAYFADQHPTLREYLVLPTDRTLPKFDHLGHIGYQLKFMVLVGATFTGYGVYGIAPSTFGILGILLPWLAALSYVAFALVLRTNLVGTYSGTNGIHGSRSDDSVK